MSQHPMTGVDAFAPAEIARLVSTRGVAKANAPALTTFVLAVLAGAFIALGAVFSTIVAAGWQGSYGAGRLLCGLSFSLGLVLVVVAGAELFTGNNLIVMSVVSGQVSLAQMLRSWAIVYAGNAVGALSIAVLVSEARLFEGGGGAVGAAAIAIANAKAGLPFGVAFARGVLANALVCLAVWIATAGRSVADKIIAVALPISAFVAAGFEHSIANLYFIPAAMLFARASSLEAMRGPSVEGLVRNLVASTLGNILGGSVLVGLVYWFVYLRRAEPVALEARSEPVVEARDADHRRAA